MQSNSNAYNKDNAHGWKCTKAHSQCQRQVTYLHSLILIQMTSTTHCQQRFDNSIHMICIRLKHNYKRQARECRSKC